MNRIAIMGTGSLGTVLGAYISQKRQIDLIDANKQHVDALNNDGAKIVGKISMNVPVKALTPDEMEGIYDLVIYLVKQTFNDAALEQLKPHLGPDSIVCTLQNGYPEPALIDALGEERVLGCTVDWGATWIGPGISELTSDPDHMSFNLGRVDGKITDKVKETQAVLSLMCETFVTNNLIGTRWAKLLTNASFSGMSAVLGCTFGDILSNEIAFDYMNYLINEIIRVAEASGAKELKIGDANMGQMFKFNSDEERKMKKPYYEMAWGPHRLLKASMLQDLEKGIKCEIDAINGVVSTQGRKYGVDTPFCDKVIEIVKGIEQKKYVYSMDNLAILQDVLEQNRY